MVTGAKGGIGLEVVRQLAARGMTTGLGARDVGRGERAAQGLDGPVVVRRLDVTDQGSVDELALWLREAHGGLDVLVNDAAVHYDSSQSASGADLQVVQEALSTNVVGAWRTAVALAPLLRAGGTVVNVSSGAGSPRRPARAGRRRTPSRRPR